MDLTAQTYNYVLDTRALERAWVMEGKLLLVASVQDLKPEDALEGSRSSLVAHARPGDRQSNPVPPGDPASSADGKWAEQVDAGATRPVRGIDLPKPTAKRL